MKVLEQSGGFSEELGNIESVGEHQTNICAPKTLWLIRHGQGDHNVFIDQGIEQEDEQMIRKGVELLDPALTELGRKQAEECAKKNILKKPLNGDETERIQLIVISPLLRTIETGQIVLEYFLRSNLNVPVILHPDIQETGEGPCDTGSSVEKVKEFVKIFEVKVDLSLITETSHIKTGRYKDTWTTLQKRLNDFVLWLKRRKESRILIVSHHGVLLHLTGTPFFNCECRSYQLASKVFIPLSPKLSTSDEELTEDDKTYLKTFEAQLRKRMKELYGIDLPARLR